MGFVAREVSRDVVRGIAPLLDPKVVKSADLRDQLERAATSIALNLAEANGRTGKDRLNRFGIALGSAREVKAAIECCADLGYFPEERVSPLLTRVERLIRLLYGLRFPKRS
jgi:four helix bundle protein